METYKDYLVCYRRKSDKCCHREALFETYDEVCQFIKKIVKRGSKVLCVYHGNNDVTYIFEYELRFLDGSNN